MALKNIELAHINPVNGRYGVVVYSDDASQYATFECDNEHDAVVLRNALRGNVSVSPWQNMICVSVQGATHTVLAYLDKQSAKTLAMEILKLVEGRLPPAVAQKPTFDEWYKAKYGIDFTKRYEGDSTGFPLRTLAELTRDYVSEMVRS